MTKEPIIIDDVDVAECEHRCDTHKELLADGHIKEFVHYCQITNTGCYGYICYYKQLKHKEQECERLKKQLMQKSDVDMFFNTPIEGWSNDPCEICPHKAENKELKTEFDKFEEQIKLQENFIDGFLFATKNSEWRNKSILEDEADAIIEKVESDYVRLEKYKQALQEIKEICKTPDIYRGRMALGGKIREIISEVIKDEQV